MINISKKKDCCGCNACGDVCPKHSITFKIDKEGFWYPEVEMDTCIDCHLCEKVCPLLNKEEYKNIDGYVKPKTYALVHKNIEVRFDSTSGGAFTALAEEVYKQGGFIMKIGLFLNFFLPQKMIFPNCVQANICKVILMVSINR